MSLNKKIISENFSRAANSYESAALVQKTAAQKLCEIVATKLKPNSRILDLGCGTGFITQNLHGENLQIFEADLSFAMLQSSRSGPNNSTKIQCDIENLPFKNESFDVIVSSFSLQWLDDFAKNFQQLHQILKPQGLLIFCVPTFESLKELKQASVESGCNFYFRTLPNVAAIKSALKESFFAQQSFSEEKFYAEFADGLSALKSIKLTGANYRANSTIVPKSRIKQFNNFCLKICGNSNKNFVLSWNVAFFLSQKI